jgi:hypothetical protein
MRISWIRFALLLSVVCLIPRPLLAEAPPATQATSDESRFLRFTEDGKDRGRLEVAQISYRNDAGVIIKLVSAVHVADAAYYAEVDKALADTQVVLYEMVKAKDSPPPVKGQHSDHAVAQLQHVLKDTLGLDYQLDDIDYTRPNFVHADMDAETFMKLQDERGESFASMMLQGILRSISDPTAQRVYDGEPTDMVDFMTRPDGEMQLKLILARRLGDIERDAMGLNMLNGTVILTERNKAVIAKLKETLASGKKDIAIFYGAAHMSDLSSRIEKMGFKPVATKWRTAWDVHIRPNAPSAFMKLMDKVNTSLRDSAREN